jgi:hypothetical protein
MSRAEWRKGCGDVKKVEMAGMAGNKLDGDGEVVRAE